MFTICNSIVNLLLFTFNLHFELKCYINVLTHSSSFINSLSISCNVVLLHSPPLSTYHRTTALSLISQLRVYIFFFESPHVSFC